MITDLDNRWIWLNGELLHAKDAQIYALSPTAQFGLNVFEGIPVYYNKEEKKSYAFRLEDHYKRLNTSARMLELVHGFSIEDMKTALDETIKANGCDEDMIVRQTLFVDGVGSWGSEGPVGMCVSPLPRSRVNNEYGKKQLKCCFSSWRRINDISISPRIKCGANYINSRMGKREAIRNGYDTCIFLNDQGKVAEGPGSCFFMVEDGVLVTPMVTDSILRSITRETIIKIARDDGIIVEERAIDRTEAYCCEEAFLCGSSMEITTITSMDGFEIQNGSITEKLRDKYKSIVIGNEKGYKNWLTDVG